MSVGMITSFCCLKWAIDRAWIVGSYAALDEFEQEVNS